MSRLGRCDTAAGRSAAAVLPRVRTLAHRLARRLAGTLALLVVVLCGCGAPSASREEPVGSTAEAIEVCPGSRTVLGLDVSHWNGTVDWGRVKASGRAFAFAKATEGTTYVDPQFAANWAGMKKHDVARSAYHFFRGDVDPIVEADHFLSVMGKLEPGDLPPTLDLESTDGASGSSVAEAAIAWLDRVAAKTGTKPILYTSPSFLADTLESPAGLDDHATLWIANWQVACPTVPAPFASWRVWQSEETGTVPGISGEDSVDLDVFDGSEADLAAFAIQAPSSASSGVGTGGSPSSAAGGTAGKGGKGEGGEGGPAGEDHTSASCSCSTRPDESAFPWRTAGLVIAAAALARRRRRRR